MAKILNFNIDQDLVHEFQNKYTPKDYRRIQHIVDKAGGDVEKEMKLAKIQADKILKLEKARARCVVAYHMGHFNLSEMFYNRWLQLEFPRKYKLKMYLEESESDE
jgi:hypothetical protein